ncbi:hypothetical protein Pmar_PMAR005858 [Perkinsus marinus ATCC 50983]|uniref:Uncharacterized protein n=1 Tax=Perkinsus marinus (strain ATCC 50983 / TXsc) TaxID=423536 RepID=C5KYE6_PERM5|nr:hypothetical protein Pmar_PMAR005858 [Perkinsus marinus ATCC 50983]EER10523.1 hypothetical protein Pmar_PMAR005858 [Perkinsus marinus ATCC 50983]|eukprot:XP_002778728.1 hypothetical protein Pmar_PMAR005858 [Perkinsus marinus ATCC 50983]
MLFNLRHKSSSCKLNNESSVKSKRRNGFGSPKSPSESTVSSLSTATDGILRRSGDSVDSIRIDRKGNFIHYGSKSHSISFADEVEGDTGRLENVFIVESFKAYNYEDDEVPGDSRSRRGCFSLRRIF